MGGQFTEFQKEQKQEFFLIVKIWADLFEKSSAGHICFH